MIFSSESRDKTLQCHDGLKKLFWSTNKNDLITFDNIGNIVTVQGDDYNWLPTRLSLFQRKI